MFRAELTVYRGCEIIQLDRKSSAIECMRRLVARSPPVFVQRESSVNGTYCCLHRVRGHASLGMEPQRLEEEPGIMARSHIVPYSTSTVTGPAMCRTGLAGFPLVVLDVPRIRLLNVDAPLQRAGGKQQQS